MAAWGLPNRKLAWLRGNSKRAIQLDEAGELPRISYLYLLLKAQVLLVVILAISLQVVMVLPCNLQHVEIYVVSLIAAPDSL